MKPEVVGRSVPWIDLCLSPQLALEPQRPSLKEGALAQCRISFRQILDFFECRVLPVPPT